MCHFVIIEDQQMVSEMLAEFIQKKLPGYQCVGQAVLADEGVALCLRTRPDLVLVDIHLGASDGIATAETLTHRLPKTHVILISAHCSPYNCYRITQSRIQGFVDKTRPLNELKQAVERVMAGTSWFSPSFEALWKDYGRNPNAFFKILSGREQEIMLRIVAGDNDKQIAEKLNISRRTAETHRYNITKKLGLSDTASLRKYAEQHGMWCPETTSEPDEN